MSLKEIHRRLRKLETRRLPKLYPYVITNKPGAPGGGLLTEDEMDVYEAELRASGAIAPGQPVLRVCRIIVRPEPRP